jgi:hypothetical protein
MKTNFLMLQELFETYHPKTRGFVSTEEQEVIETTLHLAEMDILALRNLRDFTVAFIGNKDNDTIEDWDRMSAITFVIDKEISQRGGEV